MLQQKKQRANIPEEKKQVKIFEKKGRKSALSSFEAFFLNT
jgi:hypothetical protein